MAQTPSSSSSSLVGEVQNWEPEPLVPDINIEEKEYKSGRVLNPHVITSKAGKYITVNGVDCLNFATHNYLGLADDPRLENASIEATKKYGVGSCGPRGFYGTMDVHLKLEEELAKFLAVQETVLYSYGFSTIASAIPAYAKSSDVIFVDEMCNFAIQQGIVATRGRVIKFRHNDMAQLEQLLENLAEEERKKYGRTNKLRTFIIVEGIYAKTGDLCPLDEVLHLKHKYKVRLFIDESISFGVLGAHGKGITEHFLADINDVDLIMASLENALCAYGGFCAGSTYIIDHQRLAGSGYCFSASLPPLQCRVALESLDIISKEPDIVQGAQKLYRYADEVLDKLTWLRNISHPMSPIKILILGSLNGKHHSNNKYDKDEESLLDDACAELLRKENIALTVARCLADEEMTRPLTSIRLVISGCLNRGDIDRIFGALDRLSPRFGRLELPRASSYENIIK